MSFATVLCLIPENVYGCLQIITGNGLAAGCQLFYRKIYGQFYSVEISLVLLLNKMIDSLFMYLSAARNYSFLRGRICIFIKNGISCCKLFLCFFRDCHIIVVYVLEFLSKCVK